jgi:hypothetical protein
MRILFLIGFLFLSGSAKAWLVQSTFTRLSPTGFKATSHFSCSGVYLIASARRQIVRNDTLFIQLVFETRFAANAGGGARKDTLVQEILDPNIRYVNVSTGKVTFDQQDFTLPDTIWGIFDSTFIATELPHYQVNDLQVFNLQNKLTVKSPQATISAITLIDLNGKLVLREEGNQLDISALRTGMYLLRVFSASGAVGTLRWYRE